MSTLKMMLAELEEYKNINVFIDKSTEFFDLSKYYENAKDIVFIPILLEKIKEIDEFVMDNRRKANKTINK